MYVRMDVHCKAWRTDRDAGREGGWTAPTPVSPPRPLPTLAEQRHIASIVDGLEQTRIDHLTGWLTANALICEMMINIYEYEGKMQAWARLE